MATKQSENRLAVKKNKTINRKTITKYSENVKLSGSDVELKDGQVLFGGDLVT